MRLFLLLEIEFFQKDIEILLLPIDILAFGLGFSAGAGAAEFGEGLLEDYSIPVDPVASHALAATAALYPLARMIAPRYVRQYLDENQLYSRGVLGVMVGASAKALESLLT